MRMWNVVVGAARSIDMGVGDGSRPIWELAADLVNLVRAGVRSPRLVPGHVVQEAGGNL